MASIAYSLGPGGFDDDLAVNTGVFPVNGQLAAGGDAEGVSLAMSFAF